MFKLNIIQWVPKRLRVQVVNARPTRDLVDIFALEFLCLKNRPRSSIILRGHMFLWFPRISHLDIYSKHGWKTASSRDILLSRIGSDSQDQDLVFRYIDAKPKSPYRLLVSTALRLIAASIMLYPFESTFGERTEIKEKEAHLCYAVRYFPQTCHTKVP